MKPGETQRQPVPAHLPPAQYRSAHIRYLILVIYGRQFLSGDQYIYLQGSE